MKKVVHAFFTGKLCNGCDNRIENGLRMILDAGLIFDCRLAVALQTNFIPFFLEEICPTTSFF